MSEADRMGDSKNFWEQIYSSGDWRELPWAQTRPNPSLSWILEFLPYRKVRIIDVGAGHSLLVDTLLSEGYQGPTVLDFSACAISLAQERVGTKRNLVHWIESDITELRATVPFEFWHDRALFCFLPDETIRRNYVHTLWRSLFPGGLALIATYAPGAPKSYDGCPVASFSVQDLVVAIGAEFELRLSKEILHIGPRGEKIPFTYALFEKK